MRKIDFIWPVIVIIAALCLYLFTKPLISEAEKGCVESGGSIGTALCCISSNDFPNSCFIGACGCSPENSHDIKTCDCPKEECFNGEKCVSIKSTQQTTVPTSALTSVPMSGIQ